MIDLHVHVLPGVDDGPESMEEAVAMCALAAADGVKVLIATPHQQHEEWENADAARIRCLCQEVESAARGVVRLYPGGEIRASMEIPAALETGEEGGLLTLAGSRYVLLEPSPYPLSPDLAGLAYELRVAGWRVVLAHPERFRRFHESPRSIVDLVNRGALVQISAGSILGRNGKRTLDLARWLLDREAVHFLASDGHDCHARPPLLSEAVGVVAAQWGQARAQALTVHNPAAVLADVPIGEEVG